MLPLARWEGSWAWWAAWLLVGAIGPTLVALLVVLPLKGGRVAGGGNPKLIVGALLLNAAWGIGTALLLRGLEALVLRNVPRPDGG